MITFLAILIRIFSNSLSNVFQKQLTRSGVKPFVINFVCARYTYGVALLVTLPMTIVFYNIFNMVVYYESQGMRYYIDSSTIVKTKEFAEQDSAEDAKLVI